MKLFTLLIFSFILISTGIYSQEIRNNDRIGIFYRLNHPFFNFGEANFEKSDLVCCGNFNGAEITSLGVLNFGLLYELNLDYKSAVVFKIGYEDFYSEFSQIQTEPTILIDKNLKQQLVSADIHNYMKIQFGIINFSAQYTFKILNGFRINAGLEGKYLLNALQSSKEELINSPDFVFENTKSIRNDTSGRDVITLLNSFLYGVNTSIGYDIPLSTNKKWTLTPELSFYYNINSPIKLVDWNFMNLGVSLALKYEFSSPCPPGQEMVNGNCVDKCTGGRERVGDNCLCPDNFMWNESTQQCEPIKDTIVTLTKSYEPNNEPEVIKEEKKPIVDTKNEPEVIKEEKKPIVDTKKETEVIKEEKKSIVDTKNEPEIAREEKKPVVDTKKETEVIKEEKKPVVETPKVPEIAREVMKPIAIIPPKVATINALQESITSIKLFGNISDLGSENVKERGFCWNLTGNPLTKDNILKENGNFQIGEFYGEIKNVYPNTKYFIKAFALNILDTLVYGNEFNLITKPSAPVSLTVNQITDSTFIVNWTSPLQSGNQKYNYNIEISNETDYSNLIVKRKNLTSSTINYDVESLDPETKYYCRINVSNSTGSGPWAETSATTSMRIVTCPPNTIKNISTDICECDTTNGYYKIIGSENCKKKGDDEIFCDGRFIRKCKEDEIFKSENCACDCPPEKIKVGDFCQCDTSRNYYFLTLENKCVNKPKGYEYCNGTFVPECPQNSILNKDCNCEAKPGFVYDRKTGKYIEKCPEGLTRDEKGECSKQCPDGYNFNKITQKCEIKINCKPNMVFINGECACVDGYFPTEVKGNENICEKDVKMILDPLNQYNCDIVDFQDNSNIIQLYKNKIYWLSDVKSGFKFQNGVINNKKSVSPFNSLNDIFKNTKNEKPINFSIGSEDILFVSKSSESNRKISFNFNLNELDNYNLKWRLSKLVGSSEMKLLSLHNEKNSVFALISDADSISYSDQPIEVKKKVKSRNTSDIKNNYFYVYKFNKVINNISVQKPSELKMKYNSDIEIIDCRINKPQGGKIPFATYINFIKDGTLSIGDSLFNGKKAQKYLVIGFIDTTTMKYSKIKFIEDIAKDVTINDIISDNYGNLIITGSFKGDFYYDNPQDSLITGKERSSGFIFKYNSDLIPLWERSFESDLSEVKDLAVDNNNNIYAVGYYKNQLKYDTIPALSAVLVDKRSFLIHFDQYGNVQSLIQYDKTEAKDNDIPLPEDEPLQIELSNKGIYIMGSYKNRFWAVGKGIERKCENPDNCDKGLYILKINKIYGKK
jgi:hypothetical protein